MQPGFFEVDERLARLSDLGDQLEALRPHSGLCAVPAGPGAGAGLCGWQQGWAPTD